MHFFFKNQEVQNLVDLIFWSFWSQISNKNLEDIQKM